MPAPSHRICLSLNLGWGYGSGFYFGISAGVGLEGGAYAGISIGYNTSGSFSFSASAGIAGFYVSGGYDTKGGWNAGAGWSAPLPSFGIVSFNTNMLGVSGSYSQNGGWSYNHMGVQINKSGMSFSPSVGVGITKSYFYNSELNKLVLEMTGTASGGSEVAFTSENVEKMLKLFNTGDELREVLLGAATAGNSIYNSETGMYGENALGVTIALKEYNFKISDIYLGKAAFVNKKTLFLVIQHELVHVGLNAIGYGFDYTRVKPGNKEDIRRIAQEVAAYTVTAYQADAWNELSWQVQAQNQLKAHDNTLNNYFGGTSIMGKPNYLKHLILPNIIRKIKPW